ncbi:MAG: Lipid-A-disaccharide synthetase [Bacteroidetes bacterium]|nr:Lipid-A-disaccharide synthetase [Bacteroidota bacterium]
MSENSNFSADQEVPQGGFRGLRYFLIAGEASGDLHASNLMRGCSGRQAGETLPGYGFYGFSGCPEKRPESCQ